VVVLFLDVRGFSSFAGSAESVEAALFLKKMYLRVLTDYFVDPDFFKPTGDGLMLVYVHDEATLQPVARPSPSTAPCA